MLRGFDTRGLAAGCVGGIAVHRLPCGMECEAAGEAARLCGDGAYGPRSAAIAANRNASFARVATPLS